MDKRPPRNETERVERLVGRWARLRSRFLRKQISATKYVREGEDIHREIWNKSSQGPSQEAV